MSKLFLIGIGVGDPGQLTVQAVDTLRQVDVFFVIEKGPEKAELARVRAEICRRYRPEGGYRVVEIADPPRDRASDNYELAVQQWHDQRARAFERAINRDLAPAGRGAFLVWGDPTIYDSTLRIVEALRTSGRLDIEIEVIPGISSVQVLAARHRIPLNRVGEAVHVTTGRKLAAGRIPPEGDVVVMLDGNCSFRTVTEPADIYWGAYLGSPHELLVSGPVQEVGDEIQRVRAEARATYGWIMDIYLLRRRTGSMDDLQGAHQVGVP